MNEQEIIDIVIPFVWLIIPMIGLISFYKVRTNYKVQQLKTDSKERKKEGKKRNGLRK